MANALDAEGSKVNNPSWRLPWLEIQLNLIAKIISSAAILAAVSGAGNATEYLTNGGFDTGDLTGWTFVGDNGFQGVTQNGSGVYLSQSGNYHYEAGNSSENTLSQTFSDVAGQYLVVSGWVTGDASAPTSVQFIFDGTTYLNLLNPNAPYTQYTFNVLATGNDTFTVGYFDAPSYLAFDSFSVSSPDVSATPLPSTWTMMILGLAVVGCIAYRGRNQVTMSAV